jgi:hypothetical protein
MSGEQQAWGCVGALTLGAEAGSRPCKSARRRPAKPDADGQAGCHSRRWRSAQLTMKTCGAIRFISARLVTMTLLLPHITSHEPCRMRCISSGVGDATKQPESGTQVSSLNEPAALLSTEVHLGLLSAGQVAPIAGAAATSRSSGARRMCPMLLLEVPGFSQQMDLAQCYININIIRSHINSHGPITATWRLRRCWVMWL